MIDPKELRIGSYITLELLAGKPHYYKIKSGADIDNKCSLAEPVRLEAGLLEKCGLQKQEDLCFSNIYYYKKGAFTVCQLRNDWEVSYGLFGTLTIVYKGELFLHQLQNLYYALTHMELEVHL